MTSSLALETVKATTVVLAWVLNLMCLTGCSLCTHAAQILQLTRGARGRRQSPGMTTPPFLRHPFVVPTPPPPPPAPSRWLTLQPAEVSCAEGAAPLHPQPSGPEPRRKSAAVHRGNPVLPGVSAQSGTICPGALTQRQRCQGGFPTDLLHSPGHMGKTWGRRQIHHMESGDDEEALCTSTVNLSKRADTAGKLKWTVKLHLNYHSILRVKCNPLERQIQWEQVGSSPSWQSPQRMNASEH